MTVQIEIHPREIAVPARACAGRLLLFTDSDAFAGTERHILDLARELRAAGAPVRVGCPVSSPLAERCGSAGIPVMGIPKRGLVDWRAARFLREQLRSGALDLIHAHNGRTALAAALAVHGAGRGALVTTQHFLTPDHVGRTGPKGRLSRLAHRWVQSRTDHFITVSGAAREEMLARRDAPPERVTVVPNGISVPEASSLRPAEAIRRELKVPTEAPLVVCVARLSPEKDVRTLVRAMEPVAHAVAGATCVVAGEGGERAELEALVRQLGLADRVRLIGFCRDSLSLMAAGDLFVLPSVTESFGLVLLEAMSVNRPVVATGAGGPREIVEHGRTGLLVPPGDPQAMTQAMIDLLRSPERRLEMGRQARARFESEYTAGRMVRDTLEVYHRVLSEGRCFKTG